MAVSHVFSNAVADGTNTSIVRPRDWNSAHNQYLSATGNTAGQSTFSGTNIVFGGGPNITLSGVNATRIDISAAAGGGGSLNLSAGTTSNNLTNVTFADSNGISWGLNASTVTATVRTNYASSSHSHAASGSNGSFAFDTLSFSNANGVSFGTSAGNAITASYTVPTQSNQTGGIYVTAQSTGQSSSSTYDLRTLSIIPDGIVSAGWSNGSFRISATQSNQAFSAAGGSSAFQTLSFSDNAQASWTNNAGQIAITSARASIYAQSNTTQSSSGTQNLHTLMFAGAGVASVGVTNGSVLISVAANTASTFQGGISNLGNTAGSTGVVQQRLVLAGSQGITLSGSTDAALNSATVTILGITPATVSLWQNLAGFGPGMVTGASAITQTSGSSIFVQPFVLPLYVSFDRLRMLYSFNDNAVGTAGTTSANQTFSVARYTTIAAVVYSQGVGASSRSIQSVMSTSQGMTAITQYGAGAQGSQYTITLSKTYPVTGGTSSYTTSYAVSSGSIVISSNSNTLFTGARFLDIPWATSMTPGNYWLGIGASTSSASNSSHISFAGTNALALSLAGISQSNVSVGILGAATSASDNQMIPGLGVWTTNASNISTGSIGVASISQVVSNPQFNFQLIRSA